MTARHIDARGVFPSQLIAEAVKDGWIHAEASDVPTENIQPASLDLRLGNVAYRLRCSFLPDDEPVKSALLRYTMGRIDLSRSKGTILEQNRPYLVPLLEQLDLPPGVRAKANPKSSTGRLDIFTRVITDNSFMFDEVPEGYRGRLYLEIVPRTFTIRIYPGLALNQLRLMVGHASLTDAEIRKLHAEKPLLVRNGVALEPHQIAINNGLFMGLYLGGEGGNEAVGYRAKENSQLIDLRRRNHTVRTFWEEVISERSEHGARVVLDPEKFYLMLSQDGVRIPPDYAAEMTAYDPTSGELRTHYAGFFDPGFGYMSAVPPFIGSRAALEIRAHDVPFAVEHGQNICKLSFEHMIEPPDRLYGSALDSHYQGQEVALSKHFRPENNKGPAQSSLFV